MSVKTSTIIFNFKDALITDHSAVAAIQAITHRFKKVDKRVLPTNLPQKSHGRLLETKAITIPPKAVSW
jgi:hypothetical protein